MYKFLSTIIFTAIIFTIPLYGQTAKVIALPDNITAKAKNLYAEQAKVNSEIDQLKKEISQQIIGPLPENGTIYPWVWTNGFEFSDDFKYIVPKTNSNNISASSVGCPINYTGTTISTIPYYFTNDNSTK